MCILFVAIEQHPDYPLIIAANRDEFHARPTLPSQIWEDSPSMLAGKDLQAGGSWMAISKTGRFAALTNIRTPQQQVPDRHSRGHIVTRYVRDKTTSTAYLNNLRQQRGQYNGYNLLFGHWSKLYHYNNLQDQYQRLHKGFYGLSNATLNSPWPKVSHGVASLKSYCQTQTELHTDTLFSLLADQSKADSHLLPSTGIAPEWEKHLSSIFIQGDEYGTRSSTLLLIDQQQNISWHERIFSPKADAIQNVIFNFKLC